MPNQKEVDPWLPDDQFSQVDFRPEVPLLDELNSIAEETEPSVEEILDTTPQPPPKPVEEEPQEFQYADGSSLTVEHSKRGWKATLNTGIAGVNSEVFYGKTKEEMYQNVAAGKINATKKIRELNRKVQLGMERPNPRQAQSQALPKPVIRDLTADETMQIKLELASNPALAFDKYFQLKTGMSVEQLAQLTREASAKSDKGVQASDSLETEAVAKAFLEERPEYLPTQNNFTSLLAWLAKYKLNTSLTKENAQQIMLDLLHNDFWTVETLDEAYEALLEGGLLETKPEEDSEEVFNEPELNTQPNTSVERIAPKSPVQVDTNITDTTPNDERIVRTVRRPRAGLGIRQTEATGTVPNKPKPPSEEELENLTDTEIDALFNSVRRERSRSR